ncbi:hypothetical protein [Streptomyces sp. NBC_00872]|uniref:hypothetical protein n=1 Tax=Streptomyces sp. NBC_00872 TaxID=2903686 RepID=UPI0038706606|nr:hypothetical protein OG214_06950 [Streptomyces sp. NBC_00872]
MTTDPHLLINRWTAVDTTHSSIGTTFSALFRPTGLTMTMLRQDRIRDEAFEADDSMHLMHLMHLFGIASHTALRYNTAARPEPQGLRYRPRTPATDRGSAPTKSMSARVTAQAAAAAAVEGSTRGPARPDGGERGEEKPGQAS